MMMIPDREQLWGHQSVQLTLEVEIPIKLLLDLTFSTEESHRSHVEKMSDEFNNHPKS
jgi:hypothetical protein